jgi:hypothetical protein
MHVKASIKRTDGPLRRADRAVAFLDSPAGRQFLNDLDALGWMLVLQSEALPDGERWPVPLDTRAKYPSWCNHEFSAAERAKRPKLRLVEKHPDDTA